jgi:hypothetical protein
MSNTKVIDNTEINDIRTPTQLKGISLSGFKKTEVRNQFIENMKKGKVEPACYWCAELVCAGHYADVWETILHYVGKHIHLGNPKLVIYLDRRMTIFKNIMSQGHFLSDLELRNNNNIRKLFAEIVCILTISNKKHSFEPIKINKVEEFDITQMTERLKAPVVTYVEPVFKPKDPKELFIAMNEFSYNISKERRNMATACYWIEWTIEFDIICKKRKEPCFCEKRTNYNVEHKLQTDIIWIIWDSIFYYCSEMQNPYIETLLNSILSLFCVKYTTASCKKRRYLLYYAVALLTEPVPTNIEMITDKVILKNVVEKINNVYKQIKKNEESPNTEYLFSNLDKERTFEQSMQRMEIMNKMMEGGM